MSSVGSAGVVSGAAGTAGADAAGADRAEVVMGGISRAAPRSRPLLADANPAGRSWPGDCFLEVRPGGTVGAGDEPGGAPAGAVPADAPVGAVPVGRGRG